MIYISDVLKQDVIEYSEDDDVYLKYEGETKNGKPWGNGTMFYKSGGSYIGLVKNNFNFL